MNPNYFQNQPDKGESKIFSQRNAAIAVAIIAILGLLFGLIALYNSSSNTEVIATRVKDYRLELVSLREEINKTRNELAEAERTNDTLSEKYKGLKEQYLQLINQIDETLIDFDKSGEREVSNKIDYFKDKMKGFRIRYDSLSQEKTTVQTRVFSNIQKEVAYWEGLYNESQNSNVALKAENQKLQAKVSDLNSKLIATTNQLSALQGEMAKLRAERDRYREEVIRLRANNNTHTQADIDAVAGRLSQKERELAEKERQNQELINSNQKTSEELNNTNSKLNNTKGDLESQKEAMYKMAQNSMKCTYTFKEGNDKREQKRLLDNSNSHYSKFVEKIHIHFLVTDRHLQDCNSKKIFVRLFDANNKLIKQKGVTPSEGQVDFDMETANLDEGNYFVRVTCDEKPILPQYSFKISKKPLW